MNTRLLAVFALLAALASGCESRAADGTVEILIEGVSAQDVQGQGQLLSAIAGISGGSCAEGPCSPNPCPESADPVGATACVGMGDRVMCRCPAGTHEETDEMTMTTSCVEDTECLPNTCNGAGECQPNSSPPLCMCNPGWTGPNCDRCDSEEGFFSDGEGGCSQTVDVCREGQGTEAFQAIIAEAEAELGHEPSEIEIAGARLEAVSGTALGVRSWDYLWNDEITLVVQPVGGFPIEAASVPVPPPDKTPDQDALEFDMSITRPTTSLDPLYLSGDFRVGVQGDTDRQLTEQFSIDLKLSLDINVY